MVRLCLWRTCGSSTHFFKVPLGVCHVHKNCSCVTWAPHLSLRFLILSLVIAWIGVPLMLRGCMCMVKWSFCCDVGCSITGFGSRLIYGKNIVWAWCRASLVNLGRVL